MTALIEYLNLLACFMLANCYTVAARDYPVDLFHLLMCYIMVEHPQVKSLHCNGQPMPAAISAAVHANSKFT